ncbi:MAG: elongation factor P maturation arginine rhamnosyltransferase EarP [Pseudomonadota bacterium]|nr:elongation factor P maturation arginine rhamnosyltransferase EarP [Pseudomonadota bacterium]
MNWDIFCNVVDNFGDAGVSWRLARQLAGDHAMSVRLWMDKPQVLAGICPDYNPLVERQVLNGVEVCHWPKPWQCADPAEVVIEAFGCELPERYLEAMAERGSKPIWINLEYLSAENWVSDFHGCPSPHPFLGLTRYFFFPGFGVNLGGLLKEKGFDESRDAFMQDVNYRRDFLKNLGVEPVDGAFLISLFGYEFAPLTPLLNSWAESPLPIQVMLFDGQLLSQASSWYGRNLEPGQTVIHGNLHLSILPFVSQDCYDRVLWACDVNFVRGEDSFVRAQWAAKPFVWHIYPQTDAVHEIKLMAFLKRYAEDLPKETAEYLQEFWFSWNRFHIKEFAWKQFMDNLDILKSHAQSWAEQLGKNHDLATNLVKFCQNK